MNIVTELSEKITTELGVYIIIEDEATQPDLPHNQIDGKYPHVLPRVMTLSLPKV